MSKKRKKARSRRGLQVVTLCISTTMVLILLGMVVFFVLSARNLSAHMKENLTVTLMLKDSVSVNDAHLFCRELYHRPYSHDIDYISKEQAQREQVKELGSDPSEFLGFNPFPATLEIRLNADYACRDSLKWIAKELKKDKRVSDLAYMEDLMDQVNVNISRVSIILLVLALLLTFVSFSLISNTVRLSVYANRFVIHTMKLVGASWGFIRKPFPVPPTGGAGGRHRCRAGQLCAGIGRVWSLPDATRCPRHRDMGRADADGSLGAGIRHRNHGALCLPGGE